MNRYSAIQQLQTTSQWDIIIIGGGATGLGCAVDAASRGYKTLLLEKYDFAKGTSSRATKLVHGGVRYLAQGNIRLVREAMMERGRLLKNAPHVCHPLAFVVPFYNNFQKWYYWFGLWMYEFLSGKWSLGKTKFLSKKGTLRNLPDLATDKLTGGVLYFDGQFDDSRLAINLAQTATEQGATVINYFAVTGFIKATAAYYAPHNIRINGLYPALVETPMAQRAANDDAILGFIKTKQPLGGGRIGIPSDLDGAAVYFMSDYAKFTTGQILMVDGGWTISEGQIV